MGPKLGWDPGRCFSVICDPLAGVRRRVGGPPGSGWPLTLASAARALSAKMTGVQVVPHEGTWPSGVCRRGPGGVDAWRASGSPHVGAWFFQFVHLGPCGVGGRGCRWFPLWGPGSPNHGRMGPLFGGLRV